jgi:serine/threonine protein kinase
MDRYKSLELEKELKGLSLNGFKVEDFINNGKSAAVFKAKKGDDYFALKVFDNELIERFGHKVQIKRIEHEITLKEHGINNLVKIFEGGNVNVAGQEYYFIVMELIDGENLKDYIQTESYDEKFILEVLDKIYSATEMLLIQKHIAHRDIKPENIMISKTGEIVLMDLGVLKFIGADSFSDEEEKSFVGTLRYAAPEFLRRVEGDSIDGWRALNLYQIGATLHDLIMKKELFEEVTPYTNLVIAIKDDIPKISNTSYSFELLQLTRDLMSKDWKTRIELVQKSRIDKLVSQPLMDGSIESDLDELFKLRINHQARFDEIEKLQRTKQELRERRKKVGKDLIADIDRSFELLKSKGVCNAIKKSKNFLFDTDRKSTDILTQNYLYELSGELKIGFPKKLYVLIRISNDEKNSSEIDIWGMWPTGFSKVSISSPLELFKKLAKEKQSYNRHNVYQTFKTINIYKGIVDFDESFSNHLDNQIIRFLTKALKSVQKIVDEEIKWQEDIINSNQRMMTRITHGSNNIIIDRL